MRIERKAPLPLDYYASRSASVQPVSTGLSQLDVVLGGGLRPGFLHVFCGPPASFKTSLATQIAIYLRGQGHPVLMLLADESPYALHSRLLSLGGPDIGKDPMILESESTVHEAIEDLRECSDRSGLSPVLLVDSAQRALPDRTPFKDDRERVKRILELLRKETHRSNLIVLLVSKASRESYAHRVSDVTPLAVGAESSYLESDCDILLSLTSISPDHSRAYVAKHRGWARGQSVMLELHRTAQRLEALTPEEEAARESYWNEAGKKRKNKRREQRAILKVEEARAMLSQDKQTILEALKGHSELSISRLGGQTGLSRLRLGRGLASLEQDGAASSRKKGGAHLYSSLPLEPAPAESVRTFVPLEPLHTSDTRTPPQMS